MAKDAITHARYVTTCLYGKKDNIKLNRNMFNEILKSSSCLAQVNSFRDTIVLLDAHRESNLGISRYLEDLDFYMSEYYDYYLGKEVKYYNNDSMDKNPSFHINSLVKKAYNQSPTRKLPKTIYYNSILSIYLISSIYIWEHKVYHHLDSFKDDKNFDWDLFKGDLQVELVKIWNLLCKTKTAFSKFQKIDIEDVLNGVKIEDLIRGPKPVVAKIDWTTRNG